jgi:hypothetical protein
MLLFIGACAILFGCLSLIAWGLDSLMVTGSKYEPRK